jgi:AraC-like DNA-binding protein
MNCIMRAAADRLEATFVTVKELSTALGFSHGSHFSRVFKTYYGMLPTSWRRRREPADNLDNE